MGHTEEPQPRLKRTAVIGSLLRRHPHVIIIPLLILVLCVGLGTWGVVHSYNSSTERNRELAQLEVQSLGKALQLAIQGTSLPLHQLADLIKLNPALSAVEKSWDESANTWFKGVPFDAGVELLPYGVMRKYYPERETLKRELGLDIFVGRWRLLTLSGLTEDISLKGPLQYEGYGTLAIIQKAVFVPANTSSTWGFPREPTNCPPPLCYRAATDTKYWGGITMTINFTTFLSSIDLLNTLANKDYRAQIWRAGNAMAGEQPLMPILTNMSTEMPRDAVTSRVPFLDQEWTLYLWKEDWAPKSLMALVAVVVIGSLIFSALVFAVLLSWAEHKVLLQSLLPKEAIARMRCEAKWASANHEHELNNIHLETPAQHMFDIIQSCLQRQWPDVPVLLAVQEALQRSADVYRPTAETMKERMQESEFVDAEVRQALVAQLVGDDTLQQVADDESDKYLSDGVITKLAGADEEVALSDGKGIVHVVLHPIDQSGSCSPSNAAASAPAAIKPLHSTDEFSGPGSFLGTEHKFSHRSLDIDMNQPVHLAQPVAMTLLDLMQVKYQPDMFLGQPLSSGNLMSHHLAAVIEAEEDGRNSCGGGSSQHMESSPHQAAGATVSYGIVTRLETVLGTANQWVFDAFELEEASNGRPLSVLGFWLMHSTGLIASARMDPCKLIAFLQRVEAGYPDNPYHNKRHAADVLQSLHVIIHRGGLLHGYVDNSTLLACYLAAIVHDFEHRGRTNDFLVNSHDDLAVRYNDRSPMENHHLAAAFALLKTPECSFLSGLTKPKWLKIRKLVIDLVLATDMKQHFAVLSQFETLSNQAGAGSNSSQPGELSRPSTPRIARHSRDSRMSTDLPISDTESLLSLQMALKCADLGHAAAPLSVHLNWVRCLEEEFFLQGDAERANSLPISPLCDRTKEGVTKSQVGFFDFVVIPSFKSFTNRFRPATPLLSSVKANLRHWTICAAEAHGQDKDRSNKGSTKE